MIRAIGICLLTGALSVAAAAVLVFGFLGASDQRKIREPGAHSWAQFRRMRCGRYCCAVGGATSGGGTSGGGAIDEGAGGGYAGG